MPVPNHVHFASPPDTRRVFRDFDAQLAQYLLTEHKDDGRHGAITADSIVVSGDLSVEGVSTFDGDVTIDPSVPLTAGNISCLNISVTITTSTADLLVSNGAFFSGANILFDSLGGEPRNAFGADATSAQDGICKWYDSGGNVDQIIFTYGTNPEAEFNVGQFTVNASQADFVGAVTMSASLVVDTTTLVVDPTNNRVGIGTASPTKTLELSGESLAFKNQNAASTWTFQNTDNTNATSRAVITMLSGTVDMRLASLSTSAGILGTNSNHPLALYANNVTGITITNGAVTMPGPLTVDTTTFHVDATNDRVGIGTASPASQLHTTGTVRFANYTNDVLTVDGSGNLVLGGGFTGNVGYTDDVGNPQTASYVSGLLISPT